ncbi:MAG: tetratricopeptide repeat protein [Desulfovibrionaceae bacterium]
MALKRESRVFRHFQNVLILTDVDVHARRDQESMSAFAPQTMRVLRSGAEAVDYVASANVDLVLCDSSLEDMPGVKFANILRRNMRLKMLPVIMVTLENQKHHVLDAISAGCIGYVLRPYAVETLERYLIMAKQLTHYPEIEDMQLEEAKDMVSAGNFDDAIETFQEILSIQDEAQYYYDLGYRYLLEEKYGKAIVSFKKALRINDLFAEAYKGLAEAYKGRGDQENYQRHMQKAAEIYAQFDRLEEAKQAFIEVLKYQSDSPNPYNTLGVNLRKQGDYQGAIHAYHQALKLTPDDENIHFNLGKAYHFMGDVEQAGKWLDSALGLGGEFAEAERLYKRIFNRAWEPGKGQVRQQRSASPKAQKDV